MFHRGFRRLVSIEADELHHDARLHVHRNLPGDHRDIDCWCEPHVFTAQQIENMTVDDLNAACSGGIQ